MRVTFVKILEELAAQNENIFLLTGDLGKFFGDFQKKYPERFIDVGVAEANMVSLAAGLAKSGKNVYCYSIIPFLIMRAFEQVRIDICYHNLNVKLFGAGGGLAYGFEGVTHYALEDIALMRSLPNMTVVAPGDKQEAVALARESVNFQGPLYLRFGRDDVPRVHKTLDNFKIGQGIVIGEGVDINLIATGTILYLAQVAREILLKENISVGLISLPTIKPLDEELLQNLAENSRAIFTLEEHSLIGGLGSAVADFLMNLGYQGLFRKIALPDEFPSVIGEPNYLYERYNLTPQAMAKYILSEYKKI